MVYGIPRKLILISYYLSFLFLFYHKFFKKATFVKKIWVRVQNQHRNRELTKKDAVTLHLLNSYFLSLQLLHQYELDSSYGCLHLHDT